MKKNYISIGAVILVIIFMNSFYIVTEKEQAVKTEFGKPVGGPIVDAGLKFKIPFIQTIIKFEKRIIEWDGIANEIPTKDNKYILVDTFARWRISDPLEFYKSAKNELNAQSRLDDIIDGAVRDEISNRTMGEIIRYSDRKMEIGEKDDDNFSKKKKLLELNLEGCLNQFSMNCIFMFMESLPKEVRKLAWDMAIKRKFDERILSNDVISDYYDSDGNNLDNIST